MFLINALRRNSRTSAGNFIFNKKNEMTSSLIPIKINDGEGRDGIEPNC